MNKVTVNYYSLIPASRGIGLYDVVGYDVYGTIRIVEPELPINEALNLVDKLQLELRTYRETL